jgi:phosphopantothenoylcysteine decarboxylase/phosphopantothenoylcysteine decarboxylase/phosphopantothenate--cysteine ligase
MKNVVLGITGSIAAYKAADIASQLTKAGLDVHAVMTAAAQRFITPLTLETLTKNKACCDMFEPHPTQVEHIALAKNADLFLVAPASADYIAKAAAGIADDMLTSVTLALHGIPKLICPAMNTYMFENPATQRNIETLKSFGFTFIEPKESLLACGDVGKGALADPETIVAAILERL